MIEDVYLYLIFGLFGGFGLGLTLLIVYIREISKFSLDAILEYSIKKQISLSDLGDDDNDRS